LAGGIHETADDRPFLVVLPFENLSDDPENEYFSDGVTEDIMAHLAGVRGLRVISRTTAMRYRNTTLRLPEIAEELGVSAVVEGTVRRSRDRVRVTAQLISAERDEHLWASTYDRSLEDVFAVQSDVARNIVSALQTELSPRERMALGRKPTENLEAYELSAKGSSLLESMSPATLIGPSGASGQPWLWIQVSSGPTWVSGSLTSFGATWHSTYARRTSSRP
jgi:adenylate cyclase